MPFRFMMPPLICVLFSGCGWNLLSEETGQRPQPAPPPPANLSEENSETSPDDPASPQAPEDKTPPAPLFTAEEGILSRQGLFYARVSFPEKARKLKLWAFKIKVADRHRRTPQTVTFDRIRPWMPSMDHGTVEDSQKVSLTQPPNNATISGVYFIMGGPWVIYLTLTVNGQTDTVDIPVSVE